MARQQKETVDAVTLEDTEIFEAARQAVVVLKEKTFEAWITIAKAVARAREIAGRRNSDFMKIIKDEGLGAVVNNKTVASKLERIMTKLPEVLLWHRDLPPRKKVTYAAPNTILKHCPAFKDKEAKVDEDKPKRKIKLDDAVECVRDYLDTETDEDMKRSVIESLVGTIPEDGDRFKPTDTAEDIATVLVGMFSPRKAKDIAERMLRLLSERGRKQSGSQPQPEKGLEA